MRVPVQLQRAMAAEAEAAREARAKVVAAEGEQKASLHLKEAALVLEESTSALQLRYLQVDLCPSKVWYKISLLFFLSDFERDIYRTELNHRVSLPHRYPLYFNGGREGEGEGERKREDSGEKEDIREKG